MYPFNSLVSKLKSRLLIILTAVTSSLISQNTYTFTNCGATGSVGPTPTQVINTYSSTNLAGQVSSAAGIQSWTVPMTGNYRIVAVGAAGGKQLYWPGYNGGMGASVQGDFTLTAGTVLKVLVGQKGEDTKYTTQDNAAPGGGGGTFVYISPTSSVPLMAAGGGGGGGRNPGMLHANATNSGNAAAYGAFGGANGNGGGINNNGYSYWAGSGSGWVTDGTGGYHNILYNYVAGSQGAMGGRRPANGGSGGRRYNDGSDEGGDGGFGGGGGGGSDNMGTGGGGGYSGGGGANSGSPSANYTGGGGGSYNGGANPVNTPSANIGHGYVVITELSGVNITITSSIACYGQTTAVMSASAIGGTGPYSYLWSPGGATSSTLGPVSAGNYTCTAIDANSVVLSGTIEVTQPALLTTAVFQTSVTCNGGTNGSASVSVSGGALPYSYTWSPTGGFSALSSGLMAGNYSVAVKDGNNCATSASVTITQPPPVGVVGYAINPVICAGQTTTLLAGGALTYTWTGGVINGASFSPTATATYTVFGTNSSGCAGAGAVSVTVNPIPSVSISGPGGNCPGSSVLLSASGASSYSWNTGGTTANISVSPTVNTTYTVYGTGGNGCVNQTTKNLVVYSAPVITTTISSAQVCSGTPVILLAAGATSYTWSGGVTNGVAFYPSANGTYTVTGTNANSCTNTATQALTIKPLPSISVSGSSISCAGAPVTLNVSGGVTYTWSNNSNSTSFIASTSSSTVISVSGTGSNGCVKTAYHALFVNPLPNIGINSSHTVTCDGMPVTLYGNGASTYTWLPGNSNAQFIVATPSVNTTYTLGGTSQNGCVNNNTILITVNNTPVIAISGPTAVCAGNTLSLTASGASTYTWNTSATGAGLSLNPLATAIYSVAGTSTNGCTGSASKTVYLDQTPTISAFAGHSVVCSGMSTMLFANGAAGYSWQPGALTGPLVNVTPMQNTTYTVTGATGSGCSNSATLEVIVNSSPVITAFGASICATKSAIIQASGATTYSWNTAATGSAIIVSPAVSTVYTVTGYNPANCSASATVAVTVSPLPTITVNGPANVCAGAAVVLSANGAAGYQWSNGPATQNFSITPNATTMYSVTGTSQQGCSGSASFKVIVDPLPVITVSSSDALICVGESVTFNANGGSNYSWSAGGSGSQITASPTITSVFSVTGYGSNGCANTASITQPVSECTGIQKQEIQTRFSVFPNPSNGEVTIFSDVDLDLVVINELGQVVVRLVLKEDNLHQANLSSLAKGIYWIMSTSEGIRENRKLVIMD